MLDGYVYAVGGWEGSSRLDSVERYDPDTNVWTPVASLKMAVTSPAVVPHEGNWHFDLHYKRHSSNQQKKSFFYTRVICPHFLPSLEDASVTAPLVLDPIKLVFSTPVKNSNIEKVSLFCAALILHFFLCFFLRLSLCQWRCHFGRWRWY